MQQTTDIPIPRSIRERMDILETCDFDLKWRRRVIEQSNRDPVFWINLFGWTYDPRPTAPQADLPFILYEFQEEKIIRRIETARKAMDDLLYEKTRAVGFSWSVDAYAAWGFFTQPAWQVLLGSHKDEKVDDFTIESHFGKIDYIISKLPAWYLREVAPGFSLKRHRTKKRLINPCLNDAAKRGNTIKGESANENFARQGRFTWILFDEAAHWENFSASWRAAASSTKTRIGGSTPNGMNAWGKLIHEPANQGRRVTLHWREHPLLDDAWYEAECKRIVLVEDIAQELDISYTRSVHGRVYPTWDNVKVGAYDFEPTWSLYVSIDAGLDTVAITWWQRNPVNGQVRALDDYENRDKPISYFVPFLTGMPPVDGSYTFGDYSAEEMAKIGIHASWGRAIYFGDPSLEARDVGSGKSPADVLRENGIHVITNPAKNEFKTRKKAVDLGIIGLEVNIPDDGGPISCRKLDEAMRMSRYPTRNPDAQNTSTSQLPVHDAYSHLRTTVEFFFVNLPPFRAGGRPKSYVIKAVYDDII